jgi:hypothetical protein
MIMSQWLFPDNGGGLGAGFNDSSIDHFKGHRLSSLVREVIQNSIDARLNHDQPVVVDFQLNSLDTKNLQEITSLADHLKLAKETARIQSAAQAVDFYEEAERTIAEDSVLFLSIHDSNTTGLTGPIEGPYGAWYALTKGAGLTQKTGPSLGSFGHGSKAPFVSSKLRSIFYLSVISADKNQKETRFQGKSILQSHRSSNGRMTQGTGFYGIPENCMPLLNDAVPKWIKELRSHRTQDTGTTIIIPGSILDQDSLSSVSITAIANFFYAISKGVLEVNIGHLERLTASNIVEKYRLYKARLEESFEEIDREAIVDAFQTIETIVTPTQSGEQQIPSFGRIDWYFRISEEVDSRNVAVARGNGMLITKRAPNLMKFPNLKPFDFFVCVTGGDGSELLKSIENPEHTNFEFDRLDDSKKRSQAKKKYDIFQRTVRDLLKRYASYSTSDQIIVDDLQDLFNDISEDVDTPGGSVERGQKIQIATGGSPFKQKDDSSALDKPGDADPAQLPGRGERGGDKKKKSEGGSLPGERGKLEVIGPSGPDESTGDSPRIMKLRNLRLRTPENLGGEITLYFDVGMTGVASIRLIKAGETSSEPLLLDVDGKAVTGVNVMLEKDKRSSLSVRLKEPNVDFAIEGEAREVKP